MNNLFLHSAVAPVVPELSGDDDTSNFDDIPNPESGDETFDRTQVQLFAAKYLFIHHFVVAYSSFQRKILEEDFRRRS